MLKSENLSKLRANLLEEVRPYIPEDHFEWWFDGRIRIEGISEENQIVISSDTELNTVWLQLRYSDLLKKIIKSIINADFELSFITRQEISPKSLEGRSFEELFVMAFGKKELERHKELLQKRMLKPDYSEGEINLIECPLCYCSEIPNIDTNVNLETNNKRIKSLKIRGARCSNCSEEFYNRDDMDAIRKIEKLLS